MLSMTFDYNLLCFKFSQFGLFTEVYYTYIMYTSESRGRLDLAVLFTPSTPNRQNRKQVRWNTCAGVRRSTPSFEVV